MSSNHESNLSGSVGELNAHAPTTLGDALRALPSVAPHASAWPELAAKLAADPPAHHAEAHRVPSPPRRASSARRFALPAALAAAIALALVATLPLRSPAPASNAASATNPALAASSVHNAANATNSTMTSNLGNESLATLQSRSDALERWLRDTGAASAPQSAQDLAASAELEDMIGFVDVQLSGVDADTALPLWRRRVNLLEDLAMLRYSTNLNQFKSGTATAANDSGGARVVW